MVCCRWSKMPYLRRGSSMRTELIILGILFLIGCIIDYKQFKDELRDMSQEEEETKDEQSNGM